MMVNMTDTVTVAPKRDMSKAWAGNRRKKQNRLSGELTEAGWLTVPPEKTEEVRAALAAAGVTL